MKIELEKDPNSEHFFFNNTFFLIHFRPYFTSYDKGFIVVITDLLKKKCVYNSFLYLEKTKTIEELLKLSSVVVSKNFNDNKGVFVTIKNK